MIVLLSTLFVTLRFSINTRSENCFFGLFVFLFGFFAKCSSVRVLEENGAFLVTFIEHKSGG
jgi:hypothetical protein